MINFDAFITRCLYCDEEVPVLIVVDDGPGEVVLKYFCHNCASKIWDKEKIKN